MTKAQLRAYKSLRLERDKLAQMIAELEATLYGPKGQSLDAMPRGGSGHSDPMAEMVAKHLELKAQYYEKVAQLADQMTQIEEGIEHLEPRERAIIRLHYIQGYTWEQVAVEMGYSWRQVHRIHGKALERLQSEEAAEV